MSKFPYIEIESKLAELEKHSSQESYLEKRQIKLLTRKSQREREIFEIKDNYLEKYEEKLPLLDDVPEKKEFISEKIYDIFQREKLNIFLNEDFNDEINYDDLYFIKRKNENPFKEIYPEVLLFRKAEINLEMIFKTKFDFSVRKRSKEKLPKFLRKHNIREIMKKRFINTYLINAFNKKLKDAGYINYFQKLPQSFVRNVSKGLNNKIMKKTLGEIFKGEETYTKKDREKYKNNSNLVENIEKNGNPELNLILNIKICHLFDEYLNSEEFLIIERNRIKERKRTKLIYDYYFPKYFHELKNWNQFCASIKK